MRGRIDAASLKTLGYSAKELKKLYGPSMFAAKGAGVSLDKLAQEMAGRGLIPHDGGADFLWERLTQERKTYFQPSPAEIRAGDEALARDSEAWAVAVDRVKAAGAAPSQNTIMLRQTPLVLGLIGQDAKTGKQAVPGGLYVSPHTFQNALEGAHDVTLDMLKQIPGAMADPIAIFDSATKGAKGEVVFMLELRDSQGSTVVVPVAIQGKDRKNKEINIIKSAYGKGGKAPAVQWFLEQAKTNARYVNGQKFERWKEGSGVQFSSSYSNTHGNTVHTEADLVKLREENPRLYQSVPSAVGGITPEIAASVGIRPGAIILTDAALQHIEGNHGEQIRQAGFADAREFVNNVLANVDAVYQGENRRILEFVTRETKPQGRVLARLEFEFSGDKYEVRTAGPVKRTQYKNRSPLWEGAPSAPSAEANPMKVSHRASPGQSGERLDLTAPVQKVNQGPRGYATFNLADDTAIVQLLQKADLSTVLHETGHIFMREVQWLIDQGAADARLKADYDTLLGWLGAKPGEELTTEQQEQFARGFEAYLREGKAPVRELSGAFARFKKWLTKIYRKAEALNVELNDDVRGVFDRLLATEEEIAHSAEKDGLGELTRREMDALGLSPADRVYLSGLRASVLDAAEERLREQRDAGRKAHIREWTRQAREEAGKERVYAARAAMRAYFARHL